VPLLCAVIGVESSSNMAHYGPSLFLRNGEAYAKPSSNVRKGPRWTSSPISRLLSIGTITLTFPSSRKLSTSNSHETPGVTLHVL
jgi:hypothetical protein